ncbi:hypothetical protein SAMN02910317_00592 [Ruminococcaceae bacterium FB2012]|nr:hypothetical protein SAMN02910317_00592 [Ruminococcaceae bacterium FB2012]
MGHSVNGRNLCGLIAGYMVIKGILNLILGFSGFNVMMLAVSAGLGFGMLIRFRYMNYITAAFLFVMVVIHIKDNITNIGLNVHIVYLIEAVIDVVCAFKLVADRDIREWFDHS